MFNISLSNSYITSECSTTNITFTKPTKHKSSFQQRISLLKSKRPRNSSDTHDYNNYNDFSEEESMSNYSNGNANDISFEAKESETNINSLINGLMNASYISFQISDLYKK